MTKRKAPAKAVTKRVSKARTPPHAAWPAWSEAKFWGFLRSALRSGYNKWPPKWEVLKRGKRPYSGQGKQQKWEFKCDECEKWYKQKDISVDHIIPAGSLNRYDDIVPFVQKLFVGEEGLQLLCRTCHNIKTQAERQATRDNKDTE